jgi:hypothetical protein
MQNTGDGTHRKYVASSVVDEEEDKKNDGDKS